MFSNNTSSPWVDSNNNLQIDPQIQSWIDQAASFSKNGYTLNAGIWDDECTAQMFKDGKTMFILLAILPVLIVYIFLSRSIIKGVTAGGVKG